MKDITEKRISEETVFDNKKKLSQLNLFEEQANNIRPIHYLGSKLRLLETISEVIDSVDASNGTVCDLFAGSGTVANYLAEHRKVITVDIQEYSRVLCSALLMPQKADFSIKSFIVDIKKSVNREKLLECFEEIIQYEKNCIQYANKGNIEPLCELLDEGSIIAFEEDGGNDKQNKQSELNKILKNTLKKLDEYSMRNRPQAMTTRYFGGQYFSYKQAVDIDSILELVFNIEKKYRDTYLAALISSVSDIVNTVGKQFAQPLKSRNSDGTPKKSIIKVVNRDRDIDVFKCYEKWLGIYLNNPNTKYNHKVYKADYIEALEKLGEDVKVVYADPPYTRYHYSRYYHVLETICLRDNPPLTMKTVKGQKRISRGLYREDRHQSPFSIKTQAYTAFENMFEKVSKIGAALILSYSPFDEAKENTPRMLTISQIEELATKYYSNVKITSVGEFAHSKLNKNERNFEVECDAEILIICQKN